MKQTYTIDLSTKDINGLKKNLGDYKKWLAKKSDELCRRLATMGVQKAAVNFSMALYDGINDVTVEPPTSKGESEWVVRANGYAVLFIEFGTGIHYTDADLSKYHSNASGMKHGTYGKGKGKNDYWFYTGQPGNAGGELAYGHSNTTITHGNPPNMPMYNTVKELEQELARVVKEVFEL